MRVYAVLAMYGGVPTAVKGFTNVDSARRRGLELASSFELLSEPLDWEPDDGEWNPEGGSARVWEHHWYNDEHDVVVAACDVE